MASNRTVANAIAYLHECFPNRPITEGTLPAYVTALEDLPDEAVMPAAVRLSREKDRRFFPSPSEIIDAAEQALPAIDVDRLIGLVQALGGYRTVGWAAPSPELIAEYFGRAVADACASVGIGRLTTGSIDDATWAARDLRAALAGLRLSDLPATVPRLGAPQLTLPQIAERVLLLRPPPDHRTEPIVSGVANRLAVAPPLRVMGP